MSDKELIFEIQDGKKWATNQLYLKHHSKVRNHLIRKGCSMNIWREFYNDAFILFHNKLCDVRFIEHESICPWLKKVAYFNFLKHLKKNINYSDIVDIPIPPIDIKLIEKERVEDEKKRLKAAMNQLGEKCRDVINLCFAEPKYTAKEIAEILNYASPEVVHVRKNKCKEQLKDLFNK